MIDSLIVNGCSYMNVYAQGNGHLDLAKKLKLKHSESIAQSGCSNSRIIRTTLKHSYISQQKNLYILGMTFVSRSEAPILKCIDEDEETSFEGRWTNPQNQMFQSQWVHHWTFKDTKKFVELKLKEEVYSILDRTEDLMYRLLSLVESLESRGHRVLIYQQVDSSYFNVLSNPRLTLFQTKKNFIKGFQWLAIQSQHQRKVPIEDSIDHNSEYGVCPDEIKHRKIGSHAILNTFLTNYIENYKILE